MAPSRKGIRVSGLVQVRTSSSGLSVSRQTRSSQSNTCAIRKGGCCRPSQCELVPGAAIDRWGGREGVTRSYKLRGVVGADEQGRGGAPAGSKRSSIAENVPAPNRGRRSSQWEVCAVDQACHLLIGLLSGNGQQARIHCRNLYLPSAAPKTAKAAGDCEDCACVPVL